MTPGYQRPAESSPHPGPTVGGRGPTVTGRGPTATGGGPRLIELEGPDEIGGNPDLRHEIDHKAPSNPSYVPPAGRRKRPHERTHDYGYRRHRHDYGCGHYGYGSYCYGGYGLYSPHFYWGLGNWWPNSYWTPDIQVYGGGGGSSSYVEIGQGALDLDVKPDSAEVYVDGVYVGEADQFDGHPTHLWLDEGTYELAFYREGYETIFRRYTIYPGVTIKVDDRMRPGEAIPPAVPPGLDSGRETIVAPPRAGTRPPATTDGGRIVIVASPGDAAVYLDGHFVGTAAEIAGLGSGLIVEPGDHVVEIIRPGYESQQVPVSVARGERIDLQLDLRR